MLWNNLPPPTVSPRLPVIRPRIWGAPCGLIASQLNGGWDQSRSGWRTTLLGKKNMFRSFKKCDSNQISSVIFCNHEQTCTCLWLQLILKVLAGSPQVWEGCLVNLRELFKDKNIVDCKELLGTQRSLGWRPDSADVTLLSLILEGYGENNPFLPECCRVKGDDLYKAPSVLSGTKEVLPGCSCLWLFVFLFLFFWVLCRLVSGKVGTCGGQELKIDGHLDLESRWTFLSRWTEKWG